MLKKGNIRLNVLIGLTVFFAGLAFYISYTNKTTTKELAEHAQKKLQQKENLAEEKLQLITAFLKSSSPQKIFTKYQGELIDLYKKEGIGIYVYENDSLCFWSDNEPAVDLNEYTHNAKTELLKIRNGWFECVTQTVEVPKKCTVVALIAIKNEYDFENKYIQNNFSEWLELPENTLLTTDFNYLNPIIKSKYGNALFEVSRKDGVYKAIKGGIYASVFYILAFCFLFLFIFYGSKLVLKTRAVRYIAVAILCFMIRTLMLHYKIPSIFYDTDFYNPSIFADGSSFYFSYLGDVLINSFLIFIVSVLVYKINILKYVKNNTHVILTVVLGTLILIYFSVSIRNLIFSLVNNSTITYNINNLFNFTYYSLIGFLSVGFMLFAFYMLCEKLVFIAIIQSNYKIIYLIISVSIILLFYFILHITIWDYLWSVPLVIISIFLRKYKASYNFINTGLVILIATLVISHLFNKYELQNKEQTYDALSFTLTDRQDVIAENEFTKVITSIKNDGRLKNLLSLLPLSTSQIEQSLRQVNFSGYFERYDVIFSLFKNDSIPLFNHLLPQYLNKDYFKQQIEAGSQTINDELYFIDKEKKPIRYVAKIEIENSLNNPDDNYFLYVQMDPKNTSNLGTFPDLLLDKSLQSKLETKKISYAIYENNKLQTAFGDYQYPLFMNIKNVDEDHSEDYTHYFYENKKGIKVVISDLKMGLWQHLTSISYLFIFFSFLVLSSILLYSIIFKRTKNFNSLNYRIQFILVSIVFLSLTGVVIGTVWVVDTQFEIKNKNELISKSHLVLKELQQNIGVQNSLNVSFKDNTTFLLKKLSQLFSSDISIFNSKGLLYSSSQPAIYEQGLISKFMNPVAYSAFMKEARASYSQRETIGQLNYLSAYIPLYNTNDDLIGFINLPYFSRQQDLEKELTAYLTTLFNIYTLLFIITTLVALVLSNLLTKPLRIIKQQISNIKFGIHNESLYWQAKDEIGDLVTEYNSMLLKLEESSKLLAKSERESAWREMAKQVAHEIKNPLTPMKLNIQHLQRVIATQPEDINERVNKVSVMLIEQIDTLSHIATEFSNFAKLPAATLEIFNLYEVLQNVTQLFIDSTNCDITLSEPLDLPVLADKEQAVRIFTNLLKNAEQSIPENRKGVIRIIARNNGESVVVNVNDNGSGINELSKQKIFTPNFTTKTTGTGLGLAMVKNIIDSFNGSITFETKENVGTTFIVTFPKA